MSTRLECFAEQLEIVHRQWTEESFDFAGRHYSLEDCRALPKPVQSPHPPLIVGGAARRGTVEPAVRFADEYKTTFATPEALRERRQRLDEACGRVGRDPATLRFSLMTTCVVGRDRAEVTERVRRVLAVTGSDTGVDEVADERPNWLLGTVDQLAERLQALEAAGVSRVMLQHLDHSDTDMVAVLGEVAATMGAATP